MPELLIVSVLATGTSLTLFLMRRSPSLMMMPPVQVLLATALPIAIGNAVANNTWTGGIIINEGDLRMRNNVNEVPVASTLTINNSGIFTLSSLATQVATLDSTSSTSSVVLGSATLTVS